MIAALRTLAAIGVVVAGGGLVIAPRRDAEALTDAAGVALVDGSGNVLEAAPDAPPPSPAGDLALYPSLSPVTVLVDQHGTPLTDARGNPLWALDLAPYDQEPA